MRPPSSVGSTLPKPSSADGVYRVPQRFGLASILVMMTLLAILFALLRSFEAPPSVFLFFGTFGLTICLAQMFRGDVPRGVSIITGSIFLPTFNLLFALLGFYRGRGILHSLAEALAAAPLLAVAGGLLGYLTGAVAAGVFLILDRLEQHDTPLAAVRALWNEVRQPMRQSRLVTSSAESRSLAVPGDPIEGGTADKPVPVRKIGDAESIPVFTCYVLIRRTGDGSWRARCANLDVGVVVGANQRETVQRVVTSFKQIVAESITGNQPPPWISPSLPPDPGEQTLFVPVHL